jgi:hypothetical protein
VYPRGPGVAPNGCPRASFSAHAPPRPCRANSASTSPTMNSIMALRLAAASALPSLNNAAVSTAMARVADGVTLGEYRQPCVRASDICAPSGSSRPTCATKSTACAKANDAAAGSFGARRTLSFAQAQRPTQKQRGGGVRGGWRPAKHCPLQMQTCGRRSTPAVRKPAPPQASPVAPPGPRAGANQLKG